MFERMEIAKIISESVVTPSYKKIFGKKPTILDLEVKIEDDPNHQIITLQYMRALESAGNSM